MGTVAAEVLELNRGRGIVAGPVLFENGGWLAAGLKAVPETARVPEGNPVAVPGPAVMFVNGAMLELGVEDSGSAPPKLEIGG